MIFDCYGTSEQKRLKTQQNSNNKNMSGQARAKSLSLHQTNLIKCNEADCIETRALACMDNHYELKII